MFTDYAKATVGAAITGLGSLLTALGDNSISMQEGLTAALLTLTAFSAVWKVSNTSKS